MSKGVRKGMMVSHETREEDELRIPKKNKKEYHRGAPQDKEVAPSDEEHDVK